MKKNAFTYHDAKGREFDSLEKRNQANRAIAICENPSLLNQSFFWHDMWGRYHQTQEEADAANEMILSGRYEKQENVNKDKTNVNMDILKEAITEIIKVNEKFHNEDDKNFEIELKEIVERHTGKSIRDKAQIKYVFKIVSQFNSDIVIVDEKDIGSLQWVNEAMHGLATFNPSPECPTFSKYIQTVVARDLPTASRGKYFERNGWIDIGGKDGYVTDKGILGNYNVNIKCSEDYQWQSDKQLVGTRSCAEEYMHMQQIYYNRDVSRMLMLFVIMGMLTTMYEKAGFPIRFILALIGTTNSYKTSTSLVFTRVFNALLQTKPEISFLSTQGGLEVVASSRDDSVFLYDDYRPPENSSEEKALKEKLQFLCRIHGDRVEKKRMTDFSPTGAKSEYPIRSCAMITGEMVTGIQSSMTRTVIVNSGKNAVDTELLSYYQNRPLILPSFMEGFLTWFSEDSFEKIQIMKSKIQEHRKQVSFSAPRFNENYGQLMVAIDLLFAYLEQFGISQEEKESWRMSVYRILMENDSSLQTENFPKLILRALYHAVEIKRCMKHIDDIAHGSSGIIYYDEEFFYIQAEHYVVVVQEYCKAFGIYSAANKRRIINTLKEEQVLDVLVHADGREEAARKLCQGKGNVDRYLYIRRKRVMEILEK